MIRIILGVVAGFIAWSIIWVGSDQVLMTLSKEWYGRHQFELEKALFNGTPFMADSTIMIIGLGRSIAASLMAGFLAAFVAKENSKTPLILGIVLLVVGVMVQAMVWSYQPLWYHLSFLILLIPVTVIGGRMKSAS